MDVYIYFNDFILELGFYCLLFAFGLVILVMRNNVKKWKKVLKDPIARDMVEHADEISGHLTNGWIKPL